MLDVIARVHAHMPYQLLPQYLPMILEHKINPEIYFSHYALEAIREDECREIAGRIRDAGLRVTFHGPFVDLRPGALDERIRRVSQERIAQALALAPIFRPLKMVCHPSFDDRYYVACDDLWLENSVRFWSDVLRTAREVGTVIALENVYEKKPDILRRLFEILSCDHLCFCFDSGHFNVFSRTPLDEWMEQIGPYIGHLHLHDNSGRFDEHLPVGEATFPFAKLASALKAQRRKPTITLEAHAQDHLWRSLENLRKMEFLKLLDGQD